MNKKIRFLLNKKKLIIFTTLKMINAFAGLFSNFCIVRKITMEEFGIYSMILTILGFLTTFGFSWISSSIVYFGGREKIKTGSLNKTLWSRNYLISISLIIVLSIFLFFGNKIEIYLGVKIDMLLIIWLLIKVGLDSLNSYFLAIKKQVDSAMILIVGKILFLLATFVLKYSLKELLIISIICESIGFIYIFKIDKNDIKKPEFDKNNFKEVLNFGFWQLFGFSGLYLINFGDNFVIKHFLTLQDIAIYNAAYKLFNSIASLSLIFSSYYAPEIIQILENKNIEKLKNFFYRERVYFILFLAIPHLLTIFFSDKIIQLIYGEQYKSAALIFKILMIASFIRFATVFNILVYNSLKKYKQGQMINVFRAVLNIVLDIIFIKYFGILGVAIGTLFALLISSLISTFYCEYTIREILKDEKQNKNYF